jgi:hypothetical protein
MIVGLAASTQAQTIIRNQGATNGFKSTCFSNVCLGDDLTKIAGMKIVWLPEMRPENRRPGDWTPPVAPSVLKIVDTAFRGLSDSEKKTVAAAVPGPGAPSADDAQYFQDFVPMTMHVVLNASVMGILKKATPCGALPIHGIFKSESGHFTSVLLLPTGGRLAVVRVSRRWAFSVPNGTAEQQNQAISKQLTDLGAQLLDTHGGVWVKDTYYVQPISSSAFSDEAAAYLQWSDPARPHMSFYTRDFAKFQANHSRTPHAEAPIAWDHAIETSERTLASEPRCAIQPTSVSIN